MEKNWYVIRTFPGYESKVQEKLMKKVKKEEMDNSIVETYIPTRKKYIFVRKKLKLKEELIHPGYIFIKMMMTNETMYFVRGIQYVTGYAGKNENKKFPDHATEEEINRMKVQSQEVEVGLKIGDKIIINDGFDKHECEVKNIDTFTEHITVNLDGEDKKYSFDNIEKI